MELSLLCSQPYRTNRLSTVKTVPGTWSYHCFVPNPTEQTDCPMRRLCQAHRAITALFPTLQNKQIVQCEDCARHMELSLLCSQPYRTNRLSNAKTVPGTWSYHCFVPNPTEQTDCPMRRLCQAHGAITALFPTLQNKQIVQCEDCARHMELSLLCSQPYRTNRLSTVKTVPGTWSYHCFVPNPTEQTDCPM